METSPLGAEILFYVGPVPIDQSVLTTWVIMAALTAISWLGLRRARIQAGTLQTVLEIVVEAMSKQVGEILQPAPWRYVPLLATLFIYLVFANLSAVIPGVKPPTGHIETPAALAAIVFFSVHYYGVRARGALGYVRRYTKPNLLLMPLNVLSEITRTFSLMVRLFGNIMSGEFVIGIVFSLAGLFVPIPLMVLEILVGLVQAYIFTMLAAVFIGAATGRGEAI